MKIKTKATNIELTPAISVYLEKKLQALQKFIDPNDGSAIALVEIAKTTNHHKSGESLFRAEVNLHTARHDSYVFSETADLYSSIDAMKDEIVRELSKAKDKRVSFLRRSGARVKSVLRGFGKGREVL